MFMTDIVTQLITERDKLNQAIEALQGPSRRGRPPAAVAEATDSVPVSNGRKAPKFSAATRRRMSNRMKAAWAEKRRKQAK